MARLGDLERMEAEEVLFLAQMAEAADRYEGGG